jgi:hypothetical protein
MYHVTDIRVWQVGVDDVASTLSSETLLGGLSSGSMSTISSSPTLASVTYANGKTYLGSGGYSPLYQLDFPVNMTVTAGQTYDFFLDGPFSLDPRGFYVDPYLAASNDGLSGGGSTPSTADTFLLLNDDNGVYSVGTWNSQTGVGTSDWNGYPGGFSASAADVNVYGTQVPDVASTWLLLTGALGGLGLIRRKI